MEPKPVATLGRVLDLAEYYHLSQNLESVRALLSRARDLLPPRARRARVLKKCVEGHEYDDALELLAVADALREGDSLSPEVWCLIGRHRCAGKLQKILAFVRLIPREEANIRHRLESLIAAKFKRLTHAATAED